MLRLKSINLFDYKIDYKCDQSKVKKVKERLKELAHFVSTLKIIKIDFSQKWDALFIVFNNGIISWVYFDKNCITKIYHDKYLVSKLLSEHVVNFELKDHYALVSYTLSKLTLVTLNSLPEHRNSSKFKFSSRNPQISIIELDNVSTRRVERKLILNHSGDLLIVWWRNGSNCVAPWSAPGKGLRDLANVLVYNFTRANFELISFACICGEIYEIAFMRWNPNQILILQQSEESANILYYNIFEIGEPIDSLNMVYSIRIPLPRSCLKAELSAAQDKIIMLCDDDSIMLFNIEQNAIFALHSSVSAFDFALSQLDAIFVVSDQFGRVSLYDYALNTIQINYAELFNEEILHLRQIKFISQNRFYIQFCGDKPNITIMTLPGVIDNKTLITEYVKNGKYQEAIGALQTINWNCYGDDAYFCLTTIFNQLLKEPLNTIRESQLETTLATFFTPPIPIDEQIAADYKLEMHFLAKRFFYHLLRYNCLDKAFLLAIDLKSRQLFLLLHKIAHERGNEKLSELAILKSLNFTKQDITCCSSQFESKNEISELNNNNNVSSKINKKSALHHHHQIKSLPNEPQQIKVSVINSPSSSSSSSQMPIASILKPSSSMSKAAIISTNKISPFNNKDDNKSVISSVKHLHFADETFDSFEPVNNLCSRFSPPELNDLYTFPNKIKKAQVNGMSNGMNGEKHKTVSYKTKVDVHHENEANILEESESNNFSDLISHFSDMSFEQQLDDGPPNEPPPPIPNTPIPNTPIPNTPIPQDEKAPSPLPRLKAKTGSESIPPELPPRTYLIKQQIVPPLIPPKSILLNNNTSTVNHNNNTTKFNSKEVTEENHDSVPPNIINYKSGSKIECIHFGVV